MKDSKYIPVDSRLSSTFEILRFPLAVLVVFIHSFGGGNVTTLAQDGVNVRIYDVLRIGISHGIANVAVPCFFFISGYLFFSHSAFGWGEYKGKLKKKCQTLLIPYLFWNMIPIIYSLCKRICGAIVKHDLSNLLGFLKSIDPYSIFISNEVGTAATTDFWGNLMPLSMPLNYPLWYLRDLILLVILSPLIFRMVSNKYNKVWMGTALIVFILGLWPYNDIISITAIVFFTLGAWIRLQRIDLLSILYNYRYFILLPSVFLYAILIYNNGSPLTNITILGGAFSTFVIGGTLVSWVNHERKDSSFFIFVTHMLFISTLNIHVVLFRPLLSYFGEGDLVDCIQYLIGTLIVITLCIIFQRLMLRFTPKIYTFATGCR